MNMRSVCLTGLATFCLLVTLVSAACPNKCSGHGRCEANDVCACRQNWLGGDCSQRQCAFTRAWVDTAQETDEAHFYAECGNRGSCDRVTGECICDTGFTGLGCRRMSCPNSCSGHGTCEFIEELAIDDADKRVGGNSANTYENAWDTEKIMGCKCDPFFEGHDCSMKVCPKGDDPLTANGVDMQMILRLDTSANASPGTFESKFALTYHDPYGNSFTTDKITGAHSTSMCPEVQTALQQLPNHVMDGVTVTDATLVTENDFVRDVGVNPYTVGSGVSTANANAFSSSGTTDYVGCLITFPSKAGLTGLQHLLDCEIGTSGETGSHGGFTPYLVTSILPVSNFCTVTEYIATGVGPLTLPLTELAECSNRGICDATLGDCVCFTGHKGLACELQEALV